MLIETFPLHGEEIPPLWKYHTARMAYQALQMGWLPLDPDLVWSTVQERYTLLVGQHAIVPPSVELQTYRCTVVYDQVIHEVRIVPYTARHIRTLRLYTIPADFDYSLKYADRGCFAPYRALCSSDEEPLLIRGDGTLTDTTYTNVVVEHLSGTLSTPLSPLLYGTMRAHLLDEGVVTERELTVDDLKHAYRIHLVNAMMPLGVCTLQISDDTSIHYGNTKV